jgi:hypothetical protein
MEMLLVAQALFLGKIPRSIIFTRQNFVDQTEESDKQTNVKIFSPMTRFPFFIDDKFLLQIN